MGKVNIITVIVGVTLVGLVLGISSYNEQAEAGAPFGIACESTGGVLQHWDKIIFKPDIRFFNDSPSSLLPPFLAPGKTYDIKVMQDPFSVTELEGTVSKFLTDSGYKTLDGIKVFPRFILIVDVEYEKACTSIDVDGDGFAPPFDCDDSDPLVNPGAIEIENGIDDNCNGSIDEGFFPTE